MLIKFPKCSQLIYSPLFIFLILFLCTKFVDSNKQFIAECKKTSEDLKNMMHISPKTKMYSGQPLVTDEKEFSRFIVEKMQSLDKNVNNLQSFHKFSQINLQPTEDLKYLFDQNAVKQLIDAIKNAFINTKLEISQKYEKYYSEILKKILKGNPQGFFLNLNKFLWKIDDANLKEYKNENNEIFMKYTIPQNLQPVGDSSDKKRNALLFTKDFIIMRKVVNEFIKQLKIEIVYGQGIEAINEIKDIHEGYEKTFKLKFEEMNKEAHNFIHNNVGKISSMKEDFQKKIKDLERITNLVNEAREDIEGKASKKLEEKFLEITKKEEMKDILNKYDELYLYNLLNNAIIELHKILVELVAEAVDSKEIENGSWVRAERIMKLIVKPKLGQAFDEAKATIPANEIGYVELIVGGVKIELMKNEPSSSNSSNKVSRNSKKDKEKILDENDIPFKLKYNLVEEIEKNLGLPSAFLKIEDFIVKHKGIKEHGTAVAMTVGKSKIRITAAKLVLIYERLKMIYKVKEELDEDEFNAQSMANALSQHYMAPMTTESFGGLLYINLMNPQKSKSGIGGLFKKIGIGGLFKKIVPTKKH